MQCTTDAGLAAPPDGTPSQNITAEASSGLRCEVFEMATGQVWLHQQAITQEVYESLYTGPAFMKSGIGRSVMDVAWFLRSPGATADGPLETRSIGGLEFSRVARPIDFRGFNKGDAATLLMVDKHHVLGYHAGRTLRLIQMPDGTWCAPQTAPVNGPALQFPAGGKPVDVQLQQAWTVQLPNPAPVYFFRDLSSYCAGLHESQLPKDLQTLVTTVEVTMP